VAALALCVGQGEFMAHHVRSAALAALLVAVLGGCGEQRGPEPRFGQASSFYMDGTYYLEVKFWGDPDCNIQEITVTGPGIATSVALTCKAGELWSPDIWIPLGTTHPVAPDVYEYVFHVVDPPDTWDQKATIPCYLEAMPTPIAPAKDSVVTSPVTYAWTPLPGSGWEYTLWRYPERVIVVDQSSVTLDQSPGYDDFFIDVIRVGGHGHGSTQSCWARASGWYFTVAAP
jgi:hypothetical protein